MKKIKTLHNDGKKQSRWETKRNKKGTRRMEFCDAVSHILGINPRLHEDIRGLIMDVMFYMDEATITIQQVAMLFLEFQVRLCPCMADSMIAEEIQRDIVVYCFQDLGIYPTCDVILGIYEYKAIHKDFPSEEALSQLLLHQLEITHDAEAYWSRDKMNVPTPNLQLLPVVSAPSNTSCTICQKDIQENTQVYQMTCCKQFCHFNKEDCLGESNIIDWLSQNKKCAICCQEVILAK